MERRVPELLSFPDRPAQSVSASDVFRAVAALGIGLTVITRDDLSALALIDASAEAKARITAAVTQGSRDMAVIVPDKQIPLGGGRSTTAWYEIDRASGETVGVTEDGGHQEDVEYAVLTPIIVGGGLFALSEFVLGKIANIFNNNNQNYYNNVRHSETPLFTDYQPYKDPVNPDGSVTITLPDGNTVNIPKPAITNYNEAYAVTGGETGLIFEQLPVSPHSGSGESVSGPGPLTLGLVQQAIAAGDATVGVSVVQRYSSLSTVLGAIQDSLPSAGTLDLAGLPVLGRQFADLFVGVLGTPLSGSPPGTPAPIEQSRVPYPRNDPFTEIQVADSLSGAQVSGQIQTPSMVVSGQINTSYQVQESNSLRVNSLDAGSATVRDANGAMVGAGTLTLAATALPIVVSGPLTESFSGHGTVSVYDTGTGGPNLSGDWDSYTAALAGDATLQVTTDAMRLNGAALPAGTYTIRSTSLSLAGRGPTGSPGLGGAVTVQMTAGAVHLGPASGSIRVGGADLTPDEGVTLTGYTGTVTVTASAGHGADVSLSGSASDVLAVSSSPATLTTDQNGSVTFQANVQTSHADSYSITAEAPLGWVLTIDPDGRVTAIPPPGIQGGTYPIHVMAQGSMTRIWWPKARSGSP